MKHNFYYHNCIYLKQIFIDKGLNSYVKSICKYWKIDLNRLKMPDNEVICCLNKSPYTTCNCKHFKDKSNQKQLLDFMEMK